MHLIELPNVPWRVGDMRWGKSVFLTACLIVVLAACSDGSTGTSVSEATTTSIGTGSTTVVAEVTTTTAALPKLPEDHPVSIGSEYDVNGDIQKGYEDCVADFYLCASGELPGIVVPVDEFADAESPDDYSPNVIRVKLGDTVTWTNDDLAGHTVTAVDGSFDSTTIFRESSYSQSFDSVGEVEYFCVPHPWMRGKVVVEE
jgi:hypothetical protein